MTDQTIMKSDTKSRQSIPLSAGSIREQKSRKSENRTFEEEVQAVLSARVPVTINGKKTYVTKRQPLLRFSDGAPNFEVLPTDEKALQDLIKKFKSDEEPKE